MPSVTKRQLIIDQTNMKPANPNNQTDLIDQPVDQPALLAAIQDWSIELGFQQLGISNIDLQTAEQHLQTWLKNKFHGEMNYMEKHGSKRSRPELLIPETVSVISVRMNYWPSENFDIDELLNSPTKAYISRYALGRDYHKLIRKRLQKLANLIQDKIKSTQYRVFVDSAPVLEKPIAEKAGLGWIGKHTNLINQKDGSWFFLGEIYTNLTLPTLTQEQTTSEHCGRCTACIDICPTQAIIAPYQLDARRCISYLTIELKGSIPESLRPLMGNRIYGCDDCQAICPWNKFAKPSVEPDFQAQHNLDDSELIDLFAWTEAEFLTKMEGSAIRRIGYPSWLRNIAVALGNAQFSESIYTALSARLDHPSEIVREHVLWALVQHDSRKNL